MQITINAICSSPTPVSLGKHLMNLRKISPIYLALDAKANHKIHSLAGPLSPKCFVRG